MLFRSFRMTLGEFFRAYWSLLKGERKPYPSEQVQFNLSVAEEAQYVANRLKHEAPAYNQAVLAEAARLLSLP